MQSVSPRLSIVTVVLDDRHGLQRTCESIRRQGDDSGIQHVVIDGASTDGGVEWFEQNRPVANTKFISERDLGIFDAMNKGLALCDGRLVLFLNAGDTFKLDTSMNSQLSSFEASGGRWGFGIGELVSSGGKRRRMLRGPRPYSFRAHLYSMRWICHQAVLAEAALLRELGGFDLAFGTASDYHLLLRAGKLERPGIWDSVDVTCDADGVSNTGWRRQLALNHLARIDVLELGCFGTLLDAVFETSQTLIIRVRKLLRKAREEVAFSP